MPNIQDIKFSRSLQPTQISPKTNKAKDIHIKQSSEENKIKSKASKKLFGSLDQSLNSLEVEEEDDNLFMKSSRKSEAARKMLRESRKKGLALTTQPTQIQINSTQSQISAPNPAAPPAVGGPGINFDTNAYSSMLDVNAFEASQNQGT